MLTRLPAAMLRAGPPWLSRRWVEHVGSGTDLCFLLKQWADKHDYGKLRSGPRWLAAGFPIADVRSIAEVEQWFALADLEPGAITLVV
jgi:hypothetical protein